MNRFPSTPLEAQSYLQNKKNYDTFIKCMWSRRYAISNSTSPHKGWEPQSKDGVIRQRISDNIIAHAVNDIREKIKRARCAFVV